MNASQSRALGMVCALGLSAGLVRAAYAPGTNLYVSGALASSRVFQHNGVACVPIADVAKALNMSVTSKADGYEIAQGGGANPVGDIKGKIGETLKDGQVTFTVVKAVRTSAYTTTIDAGHNVTPDADNKDLVVVMVRVKNMRTKSTDLLISGADHTSLTDQDAHAYKIAYADSVSSAPTMLPGSAVDFALCFNLPKTEKAGDFVYQIFNYNAGDRTTFRIDLSSINP